MVLERSCKSPLLDEMERKSKGIVGEMGPEPVCSLSFSYRLFGTTLKQLGQVGSLKLRFNLPQLALGSGF